MRVQTDRLRRGLGTLCLGFAVCTVVGCAAWYGREPHIKNIAVDHYEHFAERISYPDANGTASINAPSLGRDRELVEPTPDQKWFITLGQAIAMGLQNNSVIRQNSQFMSPGNPVLSNPDTATSIYDRQIQENGVLYGTRGRDAALSDFDPRFSTKMMWGRDENAQNNLFLSGGLAPGDVLVEESAQFQSRLDQQLLTGGIFSLTHNWNYSQSDQPNRLFDSVYTGSLGTEFRQPMWAGAGREFTAIAGPSSQRARGFSYVNQGIVIAQISSRISEIEFQEQIQNLLREVGELYWDLHHAWQAYEAEKAMVIAAQGLWDEVKARFDAQLVSGAEEAQVEDAYYDALARKEDALAIYLQTEARLRRMIGVSLDEERMLIPIDAPIEHEIKPERATLLFEALVNRMELKKQKANIQSLELQLFAARNLMNPRLDFVAGYRLNGFGDKLMSRSNADGVTDAGYHSAYGSMFRGNETSWDLGLEYSIPLWLRAEKAQVRQLEVRLLKARTTLSTQEDEIAHELNSVLQNMQRWLRAAQTNRKRFLAANRRVEAARAEYQTAGRTSSEPVIRAEMSFTQAQVAFHKSISEYNKALRELLYRTGRMISDDGIQLLDPSGIPLVPATDSAGLLNNPDDLPPVASEPVKAIEFETGSTAEQTGELNTIEHREDTAIDDDAAQIMLETTSAPVDELEYSTDTSGETTLRRESPQSGGEFRLRVGRTRP